MATTIITGGSVIAGADQMTIERGFVVIDDGRITSVGPIDDQPELADAAQTVELLPEETVVPGFVNAHEHLDDRRSFGPFGERTRRPAPMLLIAAVRSALDSLLEGFTTVRDCGGTDGNPLYLKHAVELGVLVGPRVFTCISPIGKTGGYAIPLTVTADGVEAMRHKTRELLGRGADFIKLMASSSPDTGTASSPDDLQLSDDEVVAAVKEAHASGKRTTVHAHSPAAVRQAVNAGIDAIEHAYLLDPEGAALMAEKGVFLVATISEAAVMTTDATHYRRPVRQSRQFENMVDTALAGLSNAIHAGVPIAMGLDVLGKPGLEFELFVKAGMSPQEALRSATINGAKLLGVETEIGTIEPGKLADLVITKGNPLVDLQAITAVTKVIVGGRLIDVEATRAIVGEQLPGYLVDHGRLLSREEYL